MLPNVQRRFGFPGLVVLGALAGVVGTPAVTPVQPETLHAPAQITPISAELNCSTCIWPQLLREIPIGSANSLVSIAGMCS